MKNRCILALLLFSMVLSAQDTIKESKPVIGISCSYLDSDYSSVRKTYTGSVIKAGGLPILIPITEDKEVLAGILSHIDALILTGGEDVHPHYYNEEPVEELGEVNDTRDVYDLALIQLAADRGLPLFGICRGEQLINVAFGGSLYQDIPTQHNDTSVNHNQQYPSSKPTHYITLLPESLIAAVTGEVELITNTHHHQAVKQVAPGFRITAWACDSIPEAIEATDGRLIWGVQFHPEAQTMAGDTIMSRFFSFIVEEAARYRFKENHICP